LVLLKIYGRKACLLISYAVQTDYTFDSSKCANIKKTPRMCLAITGIYSIRCWRV